MSWSDKFLFSFVSWTMKLRQFDVQLFSPKLLSLLLLQCFVENVILKLFLHICQSPKDVLIFPKVFSCAGTKWFFSLNYVPLLQCVTLHLISTSKWLWSCFTFSHRQNIADKPSFFLILRPIPPGRRLQLQSVAVSLVREEMWTRTPLPSLSWRNSTDLCLSL